MHFPKPLHFEREPYKLGYTIVRPTAAEMAQNAAAVKQAHEQAVTKHVARPLAQP
jgi:hypothetical protein